MGISGLCPGEAGDLKEVILKKKRTYPLLLLLPLALAFFLSSCRSHPPVRQEPVRQEKEKSSNRTARVIPPEDTAPLPYKTPFSPQALDDPAIKAQIASMTLEEKVGQLFIIAIRHTAWGKAAVKMDDYIRNLMLRCKPGGIILFSINFISPAQTITLINEYQKLSSLPLFICTDEEGGVVSRLGKNRAMEVFSLPPAAEIGKREDEALNEQAAYTLGRDLKALGFNINFAPVADVRRQGRKNVMGNRSYSSNPETAAKMAAAAVRGFRRAGIAPVLKHFPGHGNVSGDSHKGYTRSLSSAKELRSVDFLPFRRGIAEGVPMIMMGHISTPVLDESGVPASLSGKIQDGILRKELNFKGIIISDAMDMGAINRHRDSGEAALQALMAGTDIILMPENPQKAQKAIIEAIHEGKISMSRIDHSLRRILSLKMSLTGENPLFSDFFTVKNDKKTKEERQKELKRKLYPEKVAKIIVD